MMLNQQMYRRDRTWGASVGACHVDAPVGCRQGFQGRKPAWLHYNCNRAGRGLLARLGRHIAAHGRELRPVGPFIPHRQGMMVKTPRVFIVSSQTWRGLRAAPLFPFAPASSKRRSGGLSGRRLGSPGLSRHLEFSRNTPRSGARAFQKHSACKLSDASEHSVERLSCVSVADDATKPREASHSAGKTPHGRGNV